MTGATTTTASYLSPRMEIVQEGPLATEEEQPMEEDDVLLEVPINARDSRVGRDSWL